jgi:hypothetical protein
MSINLIGSGHLESADKSGTYTVTAADSGKVLNATLTTVFTLPAIAAGTSNVRVIVRVGKEGTVVTISPNSADKIVGAGLTAADDKDIIFTNQPAGSYVELLGTNEATTDSAWTIQRYLGTLTRET